MDKDLNGAINAKLAYFRNLQGRSIVQLVEAVLLNAIITVLGTLGYSKDRAMHRIKKLQILYCVHSFSYRLGYFSYFAWSIDSSLALKSSLFIDI